MSDAGQRIPEKEWRKQHSLAWAGSVSLDELWRFDNLRDHRQHAAMLRLQGCPAAKALSSYAREQARQAASKNRHFIREEPMSEPNHTVTAVSDKVFLDEFLGSLDPDVASVVLHRILVERSAEETRDLTGISERRQRHHLQAFKAMARTYRATGWLPSPEKSST